MSPNNQLADRDLATMLEGFADLEEAEVLTATGKREMIKAMREAAAALRARQS